MKSPKPQCGRDTTGAKAAGPTANTRCSICEAVDDIITRRRGQRLPAGADGRALLVRAYDDPPRALRVPHCGRPRRDNDQDDQVPGSAGVEPRCDAENHWLYHLRFVRDCKIDDAS